MALGLAAIQTTVSQHFCVRKALEVPFYIALRGIQIIFCFLTFVLDIVRNFLYPRPPRLFKKGENRPNHTLTSVFPLGRLWNPYGIRARGQSFVKVKKDLFYFRFSVNL
jgi:hypothetical protein